jgi:hypothetical protein
MRWLLAAAVMLASTTAYAKDAVLELLAWSSDGNSALLSRYATEADTQGEVYTYMFVTAGEAKPLEVNVHDTLAATKGADATRDKVKTDACNTAADTLTKTIAAKKLKGVKVNKANCKSADRRLIDAGEAHKAAADSWVLTGDGKKVHNPPTKRETTALAAGDSLGKGFKQIAASPGDGTLTVIFYRPGADGLKFAYFKDGTLVAKDL